MVQRDQMPIFPVRTTQSSYENVVEPGVLKRVRNYIPARFGSRFIVTTEDVWRLHGAVLESQMEGTLWHVLFFPGGEANKRLSSLEALAEQMMAYGAERTSLIIGFGGGIVTDVSGFLAATFMRGIPVLQIPTTLLAQVDAATGGKTGVNLASGKNLIGSFHQPLAVLIDPDVLSTLPERELRAGLFEVVKCGVIRDESLFQMLQTRSAEIMSGDRDLLLQLIAAAVRIKAEVVTTDEREGDLRRILNFGHTIGHAVEAETCYQRLLHGEAVAWGMLAAARLAELMGILSSFHAERIKATTLRYGPLPSVADLNPDCLLARLASDKKTLHGAVHFVLPTAIGKVKIQSGIPTETIRRAIVESFA